MLASASTGSEVGGIILGPGVTSVVEGMVDVSPSAFGLEPWSELGVRLELGVVLGWLFGLLFG